MKARGALRFPAKQTTCGLGQDVKVTRPRRQVLVVSKARLSALVRLVVWMAIVAVFYYTLLGLGDATDDAAPVGDAKAWLLEDGTRWLLLLFPIFIVPYLIEGIKALTVQDELTFDGLSQTVRKNDREVATFNQIEHLKLSTINGRCEELALTAVLIDGNSVQIHTSGTLLKMVALANDIADILQVEVVRND
ncbi:MAG: hypothetical protein OEU36_11045 [Gammaproteobacteria bacterium]|nr:hypothetical protein [Gammaproteobacteria bacterium]